MNRGLCVALSLLVLVPAGIRVWNKGQPSTPSTLPIEIDYSVTEFEDRIVVGLHMINTSGQLLGVYHDVEAYSSDGVFDSFQFPLPEDYRAFIALLPEPKERFTTYAILTKDLDLKTPVWFKFTITEKVKGVDAYGFYRKHPWVSKVPRHPNILRWLQGERDRLHTTSPVILEEFID